MIWGSYEPVSFCEVRESFGGSGPEAEIWKCARGYRERRKGKKQKRKQVCKCGNNRSPLRNGKNRYNRKALRKGSQGLAETPRPLLQAKLFSPWADDSRHPFCAWGLLCMLRTHQWAKQAKNPALKELTVQWQKNRQATRNTSKFCRTGKSTGAMEKPVEEEPLRKKRKKKKRVSAQGKPSY